MTPEQILDIKFKATRLLETASAAYWATDNLEFLVSQIKEQLKELQEKSE